MAFIGNRQLYLPVMLQGTGRRMNDSMGAYVASEVIKLMIKKGTPSKASWTTPSSTAGYNGDRLDSTLIYEPQASTY